MVYIVGKGYNSIIGSHDAKLILSNYRKVAIDEINEQDLAISLLQGKSIRQLKAFMENELTFTKETEHIFMHGSKPSTSITFSVDDTFDCANSDVSFPTLPRSPISRVEYQVDDSIPSNPNGFNPENSKKRRDSYSHCPLYNERYGTENWRVHNNNVNVYQKGECITATTGSGIPRRNSNGSFGDPGQFNIDWHMELSQNVEYSDEWELESVELILQRSATCMGTAKRSTTAISELSLRPCASETQKVSKIPGHTNVHRQRIRERADDVACVILSPSMIARKKSLSNRNNRHHFYPQEDCLPAWTDQASYYSQWSELHEATPAPFLVGESNIDQMQSRCLNKKDLEPEEERDNRVSPLNRKIGSASAIAQSQPKQAMQSNTAEKIHLLQDDNLQIELSKTVTLDSHTVTQRPIHPGFLQQLGIYENEVHEKGKKRDSKMEIDLNVHIRVMGAILNKRDERKSDGQKISDFPQDWNYPTEQSASESDKEEDLPKQKNSSMTTSLDPIGSYTKIAIYHENTQEM
ncbi:hypothetical protein RFI_14149 [Reticulomyxa filosa]|uniref:Uncharacterized protein n=1 Tax=Reticulomyxa filosa TaxID=46433 RepID=X6NAU4_RETFI|nr:hypothetical protein RFI_14149 [Reticulomyxa filosa]|eukprot:ETO23033.1 hypothetical protein RFI_14149 [Reticulomyxa filosa]